jgi:hypothetical protein
VRKGSGVGKEACTRPNSFFTTYHTTYQWIDPGAILESGQGKVRYHAYRGASNGIDDFLHGRLSKGFLLATFRHDIVQSTAIHGSVDGHEVLQGTFLKILKKPRK